MKLSKLSLDKIPTFFWTLEPDLDQEYVIRGSSYVQTIEDCDHRPSAPFRKGCFVVSSCRRCHVVLSARELETGTVAQATRWVRGDLKNLGFVARGTKAKGRARLNG